MKPSNSATQNTARLAYPAALILALLLTAAPAFSQNLLTNGNFDGGISPWTVGSQEFVVASFSLMDIDASFSSGSLEVWAATGSAYECIPVSAGQAYLMSGFIAPLSTGRSGVVDHALEIEWFDTSNCTGFTSLGSDAIYSATAVDAWHPVEEIFVAPAAAVSARVHLKNEQISGGLARALFDAVYVPEPAYGAGLWAGVTGLGLLSERRRGKRSN